MRASEVPEVPSKTTISEKIGVTHFASDIVSFRSEVLFGNLGTQVCLLGDEGSLSRHSGSVVRLTSKVT